MFHSIPQSSFYTMPDSWELANNNHPILPTIFLGSSPYDSFIRAWEKKPHWHHTQVIINKLSEGSVHGIQMNEWLVIGIPSSKTAIWMKSSRGWGWTRVSNHMNTLKAWLFDPTESAFCYARISMVIVTNYVFHLRSWLYEYEWPEHFQLSRDMLTKYDVCPTSSA